MPLRRTARDGAVDAGTVGAGDHKAVVHLGRPVPFGDLPPEEVGVELVGSVHVIGVDVEVYDSGLGFILTPGSSPGQALTP